MLEDKHTSIKKRRLWPYIIASVTAIPVLLLGLGVLVLGWRDAAAGRRLQERLDAIRSEGLPVDNASMRTYYESLTTNDHTQEWLDVFAEMRQEAFQESSLGVPLFDRQIDEDAQFVVGGEPWKYEASTRKFLERWSGVHSRAMRLSIDAKPTQWPIEFDSFETLLPQTQELREAARLILLDGCLALYEGDSDRVQRSVLALSRMPRVLEGEPLLISQLVVVAISFHGFDLFKRGIEQGVLETSHINRLLEEYRTKTNLGSEWRLGMIGERALALPVFAPDSLDQTRPTGWFRNNDANSALDIFEKAIDVSSHDPVELLKQSRMLDTLVEEHFASMNLFERFDNAISNLVVPSMASYGAALSRFAIHHRLAILAGGVRIYEQDTGQFPNALRDLAKYGIDSSQLVPPGGKPFGYRVEEGEAVLWGFPLSDNEVSSTPAEPPDIWADDANRELNEVWVWRLKPTDNRSNTKRKETRQQEN